MRNSNVSRALCLAPVAVLFAMSCTDRTEAPLPVDHYVKPLWTTAGDIVNVGAIRVLSDGHVILADFKEKDLWLIAPDGMQERSIAKHGEGPGEFREPRGVWPLPGDSTLIYDAAQRRLLILDEKANPVRTVSFTPKIPSMAFGGTTQTDHRGRIITPAAFILDSTQRDVPLLRWDWTNDHLDTIARVVVSTSLKVRSEQTLTMYVVPYTPRDWFYPLANGETEIIRAADYRVDMVDSVGTLRRGASIPFTAVPVHAAERDDNDAPLRALIPTTKPPFDGYYAVVTNDGESWVRRTAAKGADSIDYDVLSKTGKRIRVVRVAKQHWVLAVTATRVYISRYTDDDFEVLDAFERR